MEFQEAYERLVGVMGDIIRIGDDIFSESLGNNLLMDYDAEHMMETYQYEDRMKALDLAKKKADKLLAVMAKQSDCDKPFLYIRRINIYTKELNLHTNNVRNVAGFITEDTAKQVLKSTELYIIEVSIEEYKLKLKTIIKIFKEYKKNPVNIKTKQVTFNNKLVDHNVDDLVIPDSWETKEEKVNITGV